MLEDLYRCKGNQILIPKCYFKCFLGEPFYHTILKRFFFIWQEALKRVTKLYYTYQFVPFKNLTNLKTVELDLNKLTHEMTYLLTSLGCDTRMLFHRSDSTVMEE